MSWDALRALGMTLRPIDAWPGKMTGDRKPSPYSAKLADTLAVLRRELAELRGRHLVLQIAVRDGHFRMDGLPRSGAKAEHPGVILTFESKHGSMRIHMDRFTNWEHNLRAIAMHLEHLRLAGLYGVGSDGQQYRGWTALPAAATSADVRRGAAQILARWSGEPVMEILSDPDARRRAYRQAVRKVHPDCGGTAADFREVQAAARELED